MALQTDAANRSIIKRIVLTFIYNLYSIVMKKANQ